MAILQDESSGIAADTGSATHYAVADWHRNKDATRAVREMRKAISSFQFADLDSAEQHFRAYIADPRNQEAKVILCEEKLSISLPAHETDPTQADIIIRGTVDQVRDENGMHYVWDVKCGKSFDGFDMLHHYALQLVAYQAMVRQRFPTTYGAGIIRTADYLKKSPGPVFWFAPWKGNDIDILLDTVRLRVAEIRRGHVALSPDAKSCDYCPARALANCLPVHKEYHASKDANRQSYVTRC